MENIKANVDILCANYNNAPFLEDFFESILSSTMRPNRIIFIDDGSTDNSLDVCHRYLTKLPEILLIPLEKNVGFANSLNIGLDKVDSKYILRIDPDDKLDSHRIEIQYSYMEKNPSIDVLGTQATYFHSDTGKVINSTRMPIGFNNIKDAYFKSDNGVLHGTTLIRSSAVKGLRYNQVDVPSEDYSFFARLLRSGCVFNNIDQALTYVRIHKSSVSNDIKYSTINKVHDLREDIFGIRNISIFTYMDFISIRGYRRYMFSRNPILKYTNLFIAALFSPTKAIKRIRQYVK